MQEITLADANAAERQGCLNSLTLSLPAGHLGVRFSKTIPCEISRVESDSIIYDSTIKLLGRLAYHLTIPDKIEVYGALDNVTIESILTAYSNIPGRKLTFKDRGESSNQSLITTTVLPIGSINATFRTSKRLIKARNRVYVEVAGPNMNFEFPEGHFVEKVIIPGQVVLEGGVRTPDRLLQTLNHFDKVPGRKIVFQKDLPRGGAITKVTFPKGDTGIMFYSEFDDKSGLPVISTVLVGSTAWKLNLQDDLIVEKVIVPNEITIERMCSSVVEKVLRDYSEVEGRVIVLQESLRDIGRDGATVTITLPPGTLGVVFKSFDRSIWLAEVKEGSQIQRKCPVGYFVESFTVPGELELLGIDELLSATFLSQKTKEFSHVLQRILVLKQRKKDVKSRKCGTKFTRELV